MPELVIQEIYTRYENNLEIELKNVKQINLDKLSKLDQERKKNESLLRPNLGHPNQLPKLESLNETETKRQELNSQTIKTFSSELNSKIQQNTDKFLKELSKINEILLIKFDDFLCVDDIYKDETVPDKHKTSELIKRQLAGVSLEDPEPEPLIKREKGKWKGLKYLIII